MNILPKFPVTLDMIKQHLNIDLDYNDDDIYLTQLMLASISSIVSNLNMSVEDFKCPNSVCNFRDDTVEGSCILKKTCLEGKCPIGCSYRVDTFLFPSVVIQAILLLVGNLYSNREPVNYGTVVKVPYTIEFLLSPIKNYNAF